MGHEPHNCNMKKAKATDTVKFIRKTALVGIVRHNQSVEEFVAQYKPAWQRLAADAYWWAKQQAGA
jgi:hypothetical protein